MKSNELIEREIFIFFIEKFMKLKIRKKIYLKSELLLTENKLY